MATFEQKTLVQLKSKVSFPCVHLKPDPMTI